MIMPTKTKAVYRLKITLEECSPAIWRRIEILEDVKLTKLHDVLQVVMGWTDSHLHHFIVDGKFYCLPDPNFQEDNRHVDYRKLTLKDIATQEGFSFQYEYDFGDGWIHQVVLEKVLPAEEGVHYPRCLDGERACPPEDCGGTGGYADFLNAISDPKHEEHESMLEWIGGRFDPAKFNSAKINGALK